MLDHTVSDGGDSLVQQMGRLTTGEVDELNFIFYKFGFFRKLSNQIIDQLMMVCLFLLIIFLSYYFIDANSKFDKYLGQLQEAIVEFVRTNNPSRLFRRTRLLLTKCDDKTPPLDDAIQRGHIDIALRLIEQVVDMPISNGLLERENIDGETPLLLAAKLNHWIIMEAILKKRLDLSEKTDKYNNNILHLLANVLDGKANETIKNVLILLPNDIRKRLLKNKNKNNQTPIEIAQTYINNHCADLFNKS
jgi:hypothetical protein